MMLLHLCFLLCIIQTITLSHPAGNDFYSKNPGSVDPPQKKLSNPIVNLVKRSRPQTRMLDYPMEVALIQQFLQPLDLSPLGPDVINQTITDIVPKAIRKYDKIYRRQYNTGLTHEEIQIGLENFIDPTGFYQEMSVKFRRLIPMWLDSFIENTYDKNDLLSDPDRITILRKILKEEVQKRSEMKKDLIDGILGSAILYLHPLLSDFANEVGNACQHRITNRFPEFSTILLRSVSGYQGLCHYISVQFDQSIIRQCNQLVKGKLKDVVSERITKLFEYAFKMDGSRRKKRW